LQLCGADQWGNSIAGVDLIRRLDGREAHVFSTPLIVNKTTGVKFGKSEGGAVWLDPKKTSVYAFYQFWLNVDDASTPELLRVYTLLTREEIEALDASTRDNPGARAAQKALAREVTTLVHGADRTAGVEKVTAVLFGGVDFTSLTPDEVEILASEIPQAPLGTVSSILIDAGVVKSNGEARRLIESGAVSVNGNKVMTDDTVHEQSLVKKGKNTFILAK
jgi:tyrosyl-tRNA synthetase